MLIAHLNSFGGNKLNGINYAKTIFLISLLLATSMFLMACAAFFIGISNYKKLASMKSLTLIPAAEIAFCLTLLIGPLFLYSHHTQPIQSSFNYTNLTIYSSEAYNIIEFMVIMNFVATLFNTSLQKNIIKGVTILGSFILILLLFISKGSVVGTQSFAISSFIIILSLIAYFKLRIGSKDNVDFQKDPHIFIASGCFIQFTLTFPSSILLQVLNLTDSRILEIIAIVNYSAYTFYFYFIYKGFQCQIGLKKS